MNAQLEQTLHRICDALQFDTAGTFTFAGSPSTLWGSDTAQGLQNALYAICYTREFSGTIEPSPAYSGHVDLDWIEMVSAANASQERWEEGWQVQQFLPSGEIYAQKGAVQRAFWPGEFVRRGDYGGPPKQGTPIAVILPRESRSVQPGFYFAFGETPCTADDEWPTVRFYWNVNQEGAAPLMNKLTGALNQYHVPFRFKIVSNPALVERNDTAVLYVGRRYYRIAAEIALETRTQVAGGMKEAVPLFTLPLAAGLAFAEDPGNSESFGMSRCRLLAEGLRQAFTEGFTNTADRLACVAQHFAASGTSLERPYLNSAAVQSYEFPQ